MVETAKHRLKFLGPVMPPFPPEVNISYLSIFFVITYFCIVYTQPVPH